MAAMFATALVAPGAAVVVATEFAAMAARPEVIVAGKLPLVALIAHLVLLFSQSAAMPPHIPAKPAASLKKNEKGGPAVPVEGRQTDVDYRVEPALHRNGRIAMGRRRRGAVAQLGERCNRTAEVRGSTPLGSTIAAVQIAQTR